MSLPMENLYDVKNDDLFKWKVSMMIKTMIICFPRKETCFCRGEERSKVLVGVFFTLSLSYNLCFQLSMRMKALQMKEESETGTKEKTLKERLQEALRSFVKKRNQG